MNPSVPALLALVASGSLLLPLVRAAEPAVPAIFKDADLVLGEKLIAEHKCSECHTRHMGGSGGDDIYNPKGRIQDAGGLRGMVEGCNTQLKLQMFPEEVTAVAAVLNRRHYHFSR
jgi:mono/diheme cytochrome c family protein